MNVQLEIGFRDVPPTDEMKALVEQQTAKLERVCDYLSSCRVTIEQPQRHQRSGSRYRVRLDVTVPPGHELVVAEEPTDNDLHTELSTIVIDAFTTMRRRLRELVERQRGHVKTHEEPRALVIRLFREAGYGFLRSPDGREVYFHQNSVLHGGFERLELGTEVRFEAAEGEKGLQATTVQIEAKPGARVADVASGSDAEPPRG